MLTRLQYPDKTNLQYSAHKKCEPEINVISKKVHLKNFRKLMPIFYDFSENYVLPKFKLMTPQYFIAEFFDGEYKEKNLNVTISIGINLRKDDDFLLYPRKLYNYHT